eukprot:8726651-Ditylum_brightwellii.AAC.1
MMEHDTIFIDVDNESDSENEVGNMLKTKVRNNKKTLSERFEDIADEIPVKEKKTKKNNLILKGLMKSNDSITDKSLDTIREDNLRGCKDNSAIKSLENESKPHNNGSKHVKEIVGRQHINESTAYCWMYSLGYKFSDECKCYYADGHE